MKTTTDKFGRKWKLPKNELCPVCGQPDSIGDCNHKRMGEKRMKFFKGCENPFILCDQFHVSVTVRQNSKKPRRKICETSLEWLCDWVNETLNTEWGEDVQVEVSK